MMTPNGSVGSEPTDESHNAGLGLGRTSEASSGKDASAPGLGDQGGDYNLLPYPSMPFTDTQPAHLAALATLFGLAPPEVRHARVLELGCASGGNIIPLAARFPEARFTGVDLSRRHIDDGNTQIAALALNNVTLLQADLSTLDLAGQQFDYVICNGVFSWVPKLAQDGIFRLCRQTLAPNGVVTISYNVLPGWHLRMVIRDLCLHYAGTEGTPQQRVAKARAALEQMAKGAERSDPYGLVLRTEARRLKNVPASYMLGEFLAPDNVPCLVQDFIKQAGDWGFDFLCEVDLNAAMPPSLDPSLRARITAIDGSNRATAEQHIDFLTGRLFRRSVLVRKPLSGHRVYMPNWERLRGLHLSCAVRLDATQSTGQVGVFTDDQARPVVVKEPFIRQAISHLANAFPATQTLDQLIGAISPKAAEDIEPRVGKVVLAMLMAGRANISTVKLQTGRADDDRPKVWRFACQEAASGQPWITSLRHVGIAATPVLRALLPYLDGTKDRAGLRACLAAALRSGAVQVPELPPDQADRLPDSVDAVAGQYVDWALRYLDRHAFLEKPGDDVTSSLTLASESKR